MNTLQKLLNDMNIGPKIIQYWDCVNQNYYGLGIIVMEKMDKTIRGLNALTKDSLTKEQIDDLIEQLEKIHAINYLHFDIKDNNIMKFNDSDRFTYIDFGQMENIENIDEETIDGLIYQYTQYLDLIPNNKTQQNIKMLNSKYLYDNKDSIYKNPKILDVIGLTASIFIGCRGKIDDDIKQKIENMTKTM